MFKTVEVPLHHRLISSLIQFEYHLWTKIHFFRSRINFL